MIIIRKHSDREADCGKQTYRETDRQNQDDSYDDDDDDNDNDKTTKTEKSSAALSNQIKSNIRLIKTLTNRKAVYNGVTYHCTKKTNNSFYTTYG